MWSARSIAPLVTGSKFAINFSSVDLPQPLAPRMQTNSPAATSSEKVSSAVVARSPLPKRLVTSRIRKALDSGDRERLGHLAYHRLARGNDGVAQYQNVLERRRHLRQAHPGLLDHTA